MDLENDISGDIGTLNFEAPVQKDDVVGMAEHIGFYGQALAFLDEGSGVGADRAWTLDEKIAFLEDEGNRDLVRRTSAAEIERQSTRRMVHLAFD